MDDFLKPH